MKDQHINEGTFLVIILCHQSALGISGFNHVFVFFFSLNMYSPLSLSCSTGQYTSVSSVFRCPVCRYCQTPEPVEENKCFECGVQEVNSWRPGLL